MRAVTQGLSFAADAHPAREQLWQGLKEGQTHIKRFYVKGKWINDCHLPAIGMCTELQFLPRQTQALSCTCDNTDCIIADGTSLKMVVAMVGQGWMDGYPCVQLRMPLHGVTAS